MPRTETEWMSGWEFALVKTEPMDAAEVMGEKDEGLAALPGDAAFAPVRLPHDWAVRMPLRADMRQGDSQGYFDRWGIGWYRNVYRLSEKKEGSLYFLCFGGIYENSTVWVNGQRVGGRRYGYSSFQLDVTDAVREGDNLVIVRADNRACPVDRWYSGCGIYRTVSWREVEAFHLERQDIVVKTCLDGGKARIDIDAGLKAPVLAALTWKEPGDGQEQPVCEGIGADGRLTLAVEQPRLWSAEKPQLYTLTLRLAGKDGRIADQVSMRLGIREISISAAGMRVNGEQVLLKGVCLHQEQGCLGIAADRELWRERLLSLKEMGCNAIRAAHHMYAEEFLDLCDEMGFYVYEESFDKWVGGLYGRYFQENWKEDLAAMVKRDRNRACIFMWGVGNEVENQGQPSMLAILKGLREELLTMDPSRPIGYAMNPHFKRGSNVDVSRIEDIQKFVDEADETEIEDPLERAERIRRIAEYVDVICCNYQEQWYELIHETIPDKAILGTETYQYFRGNYEQMQNYEEKNPALICRELDYCIGGFIWTGYDYLGESMGYPAKGWTGAMIRTNGVRRPGYYILQSYWSSEPMVHFSVLDLSLEDEGTKEHWDIPQYVDHWCFPQLQRAVLPFLISTNCEEVRLFVNGKRYYTGRPADSYNHCVKGFVPWQPGCVTAEGYIGGKKVCEHSLRTPGAAVRLLFEREELSAEAQEGRMLLVTACAADRENIPCLRESGRVRFRVQGPAELVAVDNGDIKSSEPFYDDRIHLFRGAASAVLRLTGAPGRVSVWADCSGMESAQMVVVCG